MQTIGFEPTNIIVRMPNWIGDLVMATPVLSDLRKKYPQASITAMCLSGICDLLKEDDRIDELYCFSKPSNRIFSRRKEKRNLIARLKEGEYDLGILLTNSFSSAWWFWQAKIGYIIGFDTNLRSPLLDGSIHLPKHLEEEHQVTTYKRILKPLGIEISSTKPSLQVGKKSTELAKELLKQRGYIENRPLIGVHPGAKYGSAKCWPKERFRKVIEKLLSNESMFIICFGDSQTSSLVKEICQSLPERVMNLAGITSLVELIALIKLCDVLLTNDSGPMHIASAVETPLVALFGSTNEKKTGPFKGAVIHKNVGCSPCYLRECPIDFRCMKKIEVEEVYQAILQELKKRDV